MKLINLLYLKREKRDSTQKKKQDRNSASRGGRRKGVTTGSRIYNRKGGRRTGQDQRKILLSLEAPKN